MQVAFVRPVLDTSYRYYYARFRFNLTQAERGLLSLAAKQFAVAWINGVFLGRTYIRSHEEDLVQENFDLSPYLRPGENVVALLLHSWDKPEEIIPGVEQDVPACFVTAGTAGNVDFSEMGKWRVHPASEFLPARRHNSLLGHEEMRDTRLEPDGWQHPGFDDSSWTPPSIEHREGWKIVPSILRHLKEELVAPARIVAQGRFRAGVALKAASPDADRKSWRIRFTVPDARRLTFFFSCGANGQLSIDGEERKCSFESAFPWVELYQPVSLNLAKGQHELSGCGACLRFGWSGGAPEGGDRVEWAASRDSAYVAGECVEDPDNKPLTDAIEPLDRARLGSDGELKVEARDEEYAVVLEFPKSITMLPRLSIADSSPGMGIELVYSERLSAVPGLLIPAAYTDRMITRGGAQTYEVSFVCKSARILTIVLKARGGFVKLGGVQAVFRHYDYDMTGQFECSDARINGIWELCRHTMVHGSQDVIVDGMWREQLLYIGDNQVHNLACYYLFGNHEIVEWQHKLYASGQMPDGLFQPNQPCRTPPEQYRLLDQVILWPIQLEHHARYTGRENTVSMFLPAVMRLMDGFQKNFGRDAEGDPRLRELTGWNWVDHPGIMDDGTVRSIRHDGIPTAINCFYVLALDSAIRLLNHAGKEKDAARYRRLVNHVRQRLAQEHWDESRELYADCVVDGTPGAEASLHVNLLAILAGVVDEPDGLLKRTWKQPGVLQILGPYFRAYLFEVLHRLGRISEMLDEMREVWGGYLDAGLTTTPEYHPVNGEWGSSVGHPWGASPASYLMKSVVGIEPLTPGWTLVSLDPHLCGLTRVKATIPAPLGPIRVDLYPSGDLVAGQVELPAGMEVAFFDETASGQIIVRHV